jgi:general secretion pathway protein D
MRGLAQKKGTDLMTAPSVTARSVEKATIEIIREFIYPTEYEPPELPNNVGNNGWRTSVACIGGGGQGRRSSRSPRPRRPPSRPGTPVSRWRSSQRWGQRLRDRPALRAGNRRVRGLHQLRFARSSRRSSDALGNPVSTTITDNRIEMPVFSTRKVNTALTIFDGYTVAVGGLMPRTVQNVEDKVPILGDIPIIGRLFQTKAENRIKSNLIIFVTAQIIDATGRPLGRAAAEIGTPVAPIGGGLPADGAVLPPLPN